MQVAKKDDTIRKCYKLLAAIHSNSSSIITSVKQTGTIGREIKDLEEQVYYLHVLFYYDYEITFIYFWFILIIIYYILFFRLKMKILIKPQLMYKNLKKI